MSLRKKRTDRYLHILAEVLEDADLHFTGLTFHGLSSVLFLLACPLFAWAIRVGAILKSALTQQASAME